MVQKYGEVVASDNLMEFIYNSFLPIFRLNNGWLKINQNDFLKNIEWSARIYHEIQKLIEKIKKNYNSDKYIMVDGGSKLIIIFPDKYDVRFIDIVINDDFELKVKENIIYSNTKESYYDNLKFMHVKSIDQMLCDFRVVLDYNG